MATTGKSTGETSPVIHIGLGKTATTSLQAHVFPHIPKLRTDVTYNSPALMHKIKKQIFLHESEDDVRAIRELLSESKHFISSEALVDWNPRGWKLAADRNLRLFGPDATIILTIRETEDYLRSIYQQQVHEGNLVSAEEFFLSKHEYDQKERFFAPAILDRFDVDSFDLRRLVGIYKKRFNHVVVVPLSQIGNLSFVKDLFRLTSESHEFLVGRLFSAPRANTAFSAFSMGLVLRTERILELLSLSSKHNRFLVADGLFLRKVLNEAPASSFAHLSKKEKVKQFLPRALRYTFQNVKSRRLFLQNVVDKVVPYRPYKLSSSVNRNVELAAKNDEFLRSFE